MSEYNALYAGICLKRKGQRPVWTTTLHAGKDISKPAISWHLQIIYFYLMMKIQGKTSNQCIAKWFQVKKLSTPSILYICMAIYSRSVRAFMVWLWLKFSDKTLKTPDIQKLNLDQSPASTCWGLMVGKSTRWARHEVQGVIEVVLTEAG